MNAGPPPQSPPPELTAAHLEGLRRLTTAGFAVVRFQYFESQVGLRKNECAALVVPQAGGGWRLAVAPTVLVDGHLSARVERGGEVWFVWKSHQIRATPELQEKLQRFDSELRALLNLPPSR